MFREKKNDIFSNLKNILDNQKNVDVLKIEEELEKIKWKPNFKNSHGDTVSHLLVRYNNWQALESIVSKGEDQKIKNKHGHTAVWLSRKKSEKLFGPLFKEEFNKAKESGLLSDSLTHNPQINKEANSLPVKNEEKVIFDNTIEKMTLLLKDSNSKELNIILLNEQFNINAFNKSGNTFLHEVISLQDWDLAEEIINYGANVSVRNKQNQSCMDIIDKNKDSLDKDIYDMFFYAKKDVVIEPSKIKNDQPKTFKGDKHQVKRNINKVNFIMSDTRPKEIKEKSYLNNELKNKNDTTIIVKKKKTIGSL